MHHLEFMQLRTTEVSKMQEAQRTIGTSEHSIFFSNIGVGKEKSISNQEN